MSKNRIWERWDDPGIAEVIDRYWSEDPDGYEALYRTNLSRLVQSYLISPIEKVLEVGCGSGLIFEKLVPEIMVNSSYLGVDNSLNMIDIARKRFPTGQFMYGDAYNLPFPAGSFDVTLCFEVLGHLPDIQKPIEELLRVSSRLTVLTIWISEEYRTITLHEEILGKRFLHNCYTQEEILKSIQRAAKNDSYCTEIRILSDICWAFVIIKERELDEKIQRSRLKILPFQGLTDSCISRQIELKTNLEQVQNKLSKREAEFEQVQSTLSKREAEFEQVQSTLSNREAEFEQVQSTLSKREAEFEQVQGTLSQYSLELRALRNKTQRLSHELELSRNRRVVRWLDRFFNTSNLSNDISPAFQQLNDDSLIFSKNLKGFRLQSSINLQQVPFLQYPIDVGRSGLQGILLAPILNLTLLQGMLGIEIISPANTIVTQNLIPATQINEYEPTRFDFAPIHNSDQGRFWLRVFVREVDGPIRIFEWRQYPIFGLGPLQTRAFCGFIFENTL
jgi:SAM-dependent methyltransferase